MSSIITIFPKYVRIKRVELYKNSTIQNISQFLYKFFLICNKSFGTICHDLNALN